MKRYHNWNMFWLTLVFLFSLVILYQSLTIGIIAVSLSALAIAIEYDTNEKAVAEETARAEAERIEKERADAEFEARRTQMLAMVADIERRFAEEQEEITRVYKEYAHLNKEIHDIKYGKGEG